MSLSAISPHLRLLRNLRLVKFRKDGRTVYYSLDDDHVRRLLEVGIEHARE
jgi:DNA-binding transcriptional ArsR family regulator